MYPARFEYFVPTTLDEALSIVDRYGDEAKVLAGERRARASLSLGLAAFCRAIARFFTRIAKRSERGQH